MADIVHALKVDLARLIAQTPLASWILPCLGVSPPSPQLEPQQDELETLLEQDAAGWDDRLDGRLLHAQKGFKAAGNQQPGGQAKPVLSSRLNSLFGSRPQVSTAGRGFQAVTTEEDDPAFESRSLDDRAEGHADAVSLRPPNLDGLARRFEAGLTVEQMEREEAEQAERERIPGQRDERFDFGEFESA